MTLDEYAAIRLMDLENLQQEQAAAQMGVARTTVHHKASEIYYVSDCSL